ncbi:MAG TPA: hypothetical protein VJU84_18525 [Pyrinomonadaceae bacterium]|nr:hypothetical protein [Pyrinomonadaceae bacterium]
MRLHPNRPLFVVVIFVLFLTTVAAGIANRRLSSTKTNPTAAEESTRAPVRTGYPDRIHASRLRPQVRVLLQALGSRISERGKERVTLMGVLTLAGTSQPIVVVHEFPNRLRISSINGLLISFDARESAAASPNAETRPLLDSLYYDSAESFFIAQWRGAATRFLGGRARAAESDDGPEYDIYEVIDEDGSRGSDHARTKKYFFNSDTQVLEIVRYQIQKDGEMVSVETRLGDWHKVEGQHIPGTVTRFENGRVVLSFISRSTTLSPREPTVAEPLRRNSA